MPWARRDCAFARRPFRISISGLAATIRLFPSIPGRGEFLFEIHDFLDLCQKPAIDFREGENFINRQAGSQSVADEKYPLRIWNAELRRDHFARQDVAVAVNFIANAPRFAVSTQSIAPDFE